MTMGRYAGNSTICWDCANAVGKCSWSEKFKPVKGWTVVKSTKDGQTTYVVLDCPQFIRDAYCNGLKKMSEVQTE